MSSLAANAGSVPPAKSGGRELGLRIASALVLAPIAFGAIYLGTPYFEILVGLATLLMVWEWQRMCGSRGFDFSLFVFSICILAALCSVRFLDDPSIAIAFLVFGALPAIFLWEIGLTKTHPTWSMSGFLLIGGAVVGLAWLRSDPQIGRELVIALVALVAITDIGAYAAGRLIGGPRLAPKISPGKTWAGLAGAIILTVLAALIWAHLTPDADWRIYFLIGFGIAIVAQAGDLLISTVKRRFELKDTGALIPGHGGVLDRVDGLLLATLAMTTLLLIAGKEIL